MTAVGVFALGLFACGGTRTVGSSTVAPHEEPAPTEPIATEEEPELQEPKPAQLARSVRMSLELVATEAKPVTTNAVLVAVDETGTSTRHELGMFDGTCNDATPSLRAKKPDLFLGFVCVPGPSQRGSVVHIVHRTNRLVVLRAWRDADSNTEPAFDDFAVVKEVVVESDRVLRRYLFSPAKRRPVSR